MANLGILREQHDLAVRLNLHVWISVERLCTARLRQSFLGRRAERQCEHETAAREARQLDEAATGELRRFGRAFGVQLLHELG